MPIGTHARIPADVADYRDAVVEAAGPLAPSRGAAMRLVIMCAGRQPGEVAIDAARISAARASE